MAINDYYKEVDEFLKKTKSSFSDKVKEDIGDKEAFLDAQISTLTSDWFLYFLRLYRYLVFY